MSSERIARPLAGECDWFSVNWLEVHKRTGLNPLTIPGVRIKPGEAWAEVHRSHLSLIGYQRPPTLLERTNRVICDDGRVLRPHQVEGVVFLQTHRGALLCDEMRVGKTPQIIYAHSPGDGALLVISPNSARLAWHEWAARRFGWCVDEECVLCGSLAERIGGISIQSRPSFLAVEHVTFKPEEIIERKPHVIFMTAAGARGWSELYAKNVVGTFAVDEAHLMGVQNKNSETVHAMRKLGSMAAHVVLATGTPLWNKPKGLWPLLDIACPGAFGKYFDFCMRYGDPQLTAHGTRFDGLSHAEELRDRLAEVMLRRRWSDLQDSLPAFTRSIELCDIADDERQKVTDQARKIRAALGTATVVGEMSRMRKLLAARKVDTAVKLASDRAMDGQSVIVWTWHRDVANKVVERLRARELRVVGAISGELAVDAREAEVLRARTLPAPVIFVATIAVASLGLDLSFAPHEIFCELDWTPANIQQAEMRPYNGKQPVDVTFCVADCMEDRELASSLIGKLEHAQTLGLQSGMGDARDVLSRSFKLDEGETTCLMDRMLEEMGETL